MTRHEQFAAEESPRSGPIAVLGTVPKNNSETIRIAIDEYKGFTFCDIRVGIAGQDGQFVPTKKGCTIPLRRLPAVIDFLQSAHREAERLGLFHTET